MLEGVVPASVAPTLEDRRPATLLPMAVARMGGFAALATLGVLEWARMVSGAGVLRPLSWVVLAVAAAVAVTTCDRLPARARDWALIPVALAGLLAAVLAAGLPVGLLRPGLWPELADGLARGVEAMGGAQLPYTGPDPWPGLTLNLLGALLCMVAALLVMWPREHGRGHPLIALVALITLVAVPMVSVGGARPLLLGLALAALTVAFLWLERIPLRPGLGVAALMLVALAGALPLATFADREGPWFDYGAFAEGLGPVAPVRFDWTQRYGPITWPRQGTEVMRVSAPQPAYWKARNLEAFDGAAWRDYGAASPDGPDAVADLPRTWRSRSAWTWTAAVSVRRLRGREIVGAGTNLGVTGSTRSARPEGSPGAWATSDDLRAGDAYRVRVHYPRPTADELARSTAGADGAQFDDLAITVPFRRPVKAPWAITSRPAERFVRAATVRFSPFAEDRRPLAEYPRLGRSANGLVALRRSPYWRTWLLAERLAAGADSPAAYVRAVDAHLASEGFAYAERPDEPLPGRAALDAFLFDTKSGYCQHYAGAMALLLRMGGIPARVATGFSPGGYSRSKEAWVVRDSDAHAWVEAWFDAYGWVTFDPTPPATPARSQIAAIEEAVPAAPPERDADAGGAGAARPSGVSLDVLRDRQAAEGTAPSDEAGGPAWWMWALGAGAAALATALLVLRHRRRRRLAGLTPVDRAVAELDAALRRAGRPAAPGTTLRQLEQRLGRGSGEDGVAYLRALRSARYAGAAPPTPAQRRALRRSLGEGLGLSGRLRALWALPPRRL